MSICSVIIILLLLLSRQVTEFQTATFSIIFEKYSHHSTQNAFIAKIFYIIIPIHATALHLRTAPFSN